MPNGRRKSSDQIYNYEISMLNCAISQLNDLPLADPLTRGLLLQELKTYYSTEMLTGQKNVHDHCTPAQILRFRHKLHTFINFYQQTVRYVQQNELHDTAH